MASMVFLSAKAEQEKAFQVGLLLLRNLAMKVVVVKTICNEQVQFAVSTRGRRDDLLLKTAVQEFFRRIVRRCVDYCTPCAVCNAPQIAHQVVGGAPKQKAPFRLWKSKTGEESYDPLTPS